MDEPRAADSRAADPGTAGAETADSGDAKVWLAPARAIRRPGNQGRGPARYPGRNRSGATPGGGLVGYRVEATDGTAGAIDRATYDLDTAQVVVSGPDGDLVLLDVDAVQRIDHRNHRVYLDRSCRQIAAAPHYAT